MGGAVWAKKLAHSALWEEVPQWTCFEVFSQKSCKIGLLLYLHVKWEHWGKRSDTTGQNHTGSKWQSQNLYPDSMSTHF